VSAEEPDNQVLQRSAQRLRSATMQLLIALCLRERHRRAAAEHRRSADKAVKLVGCSQEVELASRSLPPVTFREPRSGPIRGFVLGVNAASLRKSEGASG
jgi:hypothetical protein